MKRVLIIGITGCLDDHQPPVTKPLDIEFELLYCGICHSDLHQIKKILAAMESMVKVNGITF